LALLARSAGSAWNSGRFDYQSISVEPFNVARAMPFGFSDEELNSITALTLLDFPAITATRVGGFSI
jgi:hypothetical protein